MSSVTIKKYPEKDFESSRSAEFTISASFFKYYIEASEMSTRLWWFLLVLLLSKASASETGRSKNTIDHESSLCFGKDLICIPDSYDRRQRPRGDVEIYLLLRNGKSHTVSLSVSTLLTLDSDNLGTMRYKYCSYGFQTLTTLTSIDQKKFTLSLTLHWVVFWYDERVNISSRVSPYIQLSEEIQAKLWTPMIDIYPMKSVKKPSQMFGDNVYRPGKKWLSLSGFPIYVLDVS